MSELAQQILAHVTQANYRPVKPRASSPSSLASTPTSAGRQAGDQAACAARKARLRSQSPCPAGDRRRSVAAGGQVPSISRRTRLRHAARVAGQRKAARYLHPRRSRSTPPPATRCSCGSSNRHRDVRRTNPLGRNRRNHRARNAQFVGTYFESAGNGFVQVDGTVFAQPISSATPGQEREARRQSRLRDGPLPDALPRRRRRDHRGARPARRARRRHAVDHPRFNLPDDFPDDALDEARAPGGRVRRIDRRPAETSPATRSSPSTRSTPAISTTRSRLHGSTTGTGGSASTSPTWPTSCRRAALDREARNAAPASTCRSGCCRCSRR